MSRLADIIRKKNRLVIGVLSGTSLDAVDVVLTRISGGGLNTGIRILGYKEFKIPAVLKELILNISAVNNSSVADICKMNVVLARFYSKCILKALKSFSCKPGEIDLIGSHGQTIHHLPEKCRILGFNAVSTLQIGDPSVIANLTGITTVGDFRIADIGVGGSGAPLVPYLDYILFAAKKINRVLLNIGGIANITVLHAGTAFNDVMAFDTGPGNMMIDYLSKKYFGKDFDKNSLIAAKGKVNLDLFLKIKKSDKFFSLKPPKSTGRELYNRIFIEMILKDFPGLNRYDIIRTFTEYTAFTIAYNIKNYSGGLDNYELIVSGGGANNPLLINSIKYLTDNPDIVKMNLKGINADNKEAVLFAVLANEALNGIPANMMKVTGSTKKAILGKICQVV